MITAGVKRCRGGAAGDVRIIEICRENFSSRASCWLAVLPVLIRCGCDVAMGKSKKSRVSRTRWRVRCCAKTPEESTPPYRLRRGEGMEGAVPNSAAFS
jgi:hypothetical protein